MRKVRAVLASPSDRVRVPIHLSGNSAIIGAKQKRKVEFNSEKRQLQTNENAT